MLDGKSLHSHPRAEYYDDFDKKGTAPARVDPNDHTMHSASFIDYIGRKNRDCAANTLKPFLIEGKKFSNEQNAMLTAAFIRNLPVKVIGAHRDDIEFLSKIFKRKIDPTTIKHHSRDKDFNCLRQIFAEASSDNNPENSELWIIVFPSEQYVSQIASLVDAIFLDFEKISRNHQNVAAQTYDADIREIHFPLLEKTICEWTGFGDAIGRYIRHGDVVIFGNLDFLLPTLEKAGFNSNATHWSKFGINKMFGIKVLTHGQNLRRTVLIGVNESYWGDALAQYVKSAVAAGAKHILYGSKAATLVDKKTINRVQAPSTFMTYSSEGGLSSQISLTKGIRYKTENILSLFDIDASGIAITVPTVIGEDQSQREDYEMIQPAVMDCENGHIATVVDQYNCLLEDSFGSEFADFVSFLPVHFMTDYVHQRHEIISSADEKLRIDDHDSKQDAEEQKRPANDLANTNETLRASAFAKIGGFFAFYCLIHGLRETGEETLTIHSVRKGVSVKENIKTVHSNINNGLGEDALRGLKIPHKPINTVPRTTALAIALVAQKFGFVEMFKMARRRLVVPTVFTKLTDDDKLRLRMLELKFSTQVGNYWNGKNIVKHISQSGMINKLEKIGQVGAFYRRNALVQAVVSGEKEASRQIDLAKSYHTSLNDSHYNTTNDLYSLILDLKLGKIDGKRNLENVTKKLSNVRQAYFGMEPENAKWWQTNFHKCAVATLFLDAAFYLEAGSEDHFVPGMKRLYVAHLLNNQYVGSELAETYGEILRSIKQAENTTIVSMAMNREANANKSFRKFFDKTDWTRKLRDNESVSMLASDLSEREEHILKLIRD